MRNSDWPCPPHTDLSPHGGGWGRSPEQLTSGKEQVITKAQVERLKREDWHQVFTGEKILDAPTYSYAGLAAVASAWQDSRILLSGRQTEGFMPEQLAELQWVMPVQTEVGLRIFGSSSPYPLSALRTLTAWLRLPGWQTRKIFSGQTHQPWEKRSNHTSISKYPFWARLCGEAYTTNLLWDSHTLTHRLIHSHKVTQHYKKLI